jgi:hypothetical protein
MGFLVQWYCRACKRAQFSRKGTLIANYFLDFNHKIVASIAQLTSTTQVNDVQHVLAHGKHSVGKPPCNAVKIVAWSTTGT